MQYSKVRRTIFEILKTKLDIKNYKNQDFAVFETAYFSVEALRHFWKTVLNLKSVHNFHQQVRFKASFFSGDSSKPVIFIRSRWRSFPEDLW